ncbi:cupin domain-containing protein [Bacteroides sp. 51]|uniref:cupin domain-containing protein n=1 Tax=Bacteroides sp. 51 TaxID=2302938 RepID=UPI0013D04F52|nr:cupin domain-containing protein [Bacteroides sp. 51]NDV82276.1 cupin domain-containing protein [Bacteroides sp. 51]
MATIFKSTQRDFKEAPNKIDYFKIFTDVSITGKNLKTQNLNFDLRQLHPGQYSAPYHSHRHAEELFMIISGSATLRTPNGLEIVEAGDLMFFEMGETGAHQLYNHTTAPCTFLDVRTYIGHDVCDYPDSNKTLIAPTMEVFGKDSQVPYFEGEEHIRDVWEKLK